MKPSLITAAMNVMSKSAMPLNAVFRKLSALGAAFSAACLFPVQALALPEDGAISLLEAASPVAEEVHIFHNWILMPIMVIISLFVLALLIWVIFRYNEKANPVARQFSHNTLVEVVWTVVPIVILLFISLFSFELLYKEDRIPDGKIAVLEVDAAQSEFTFANDFNARRKVKNADHLDVVLTRSGSATKLKHRKDFTVDGFGDDVLTISLKEAAQPGDQVTIRGGRTRVGAQKILFMFGEDRSEIATAPTVTLKAIGRQWGWNYQYPEFGEFELSADLLSREETTNELYLYATTSDVVLPVGETIRLITNSSDVIHAWAMPAFAIKIDAVPGRNNETWFKANRTGMFYGQCSEICGKDHAFMPISVKVVTRPEFEAWVDAQRIDNDEEPMFNTTNAVNVAAVAVDAATPTN